MFAGQFIKGSVQFARGKSFAGFYLLAAFPPVGVGVRKNILRGGFGRSGLRIVLNRIF
jgi:hypothetical protein